MLIERTNSNDFIIRLSKDVDSFGLQRLIEYARYLELTSKSSASESDAEKIANEMNSLWWNKKGKKLFNDDSRR